MFGEYDSLEDRIPLAQGVCKSDDVNVSRATPSISDMPGDDLGSKIAQRKRPGRAWWPSDGRWN